MSPRNARRAEHRPEDAPNHPPIDVREVDIELVVASPLDPRHRGRGKEDDGMDDLVASVKADGILQPIVVREAGAMFQIVAGHRRRRAAGLAGLLTVPVAIRNVSDQKLIELALAENVHRKEMHWLDEAAAFKQLQDMDPLLKDLAVLGAHVGRSATYVRDRLKLLKLDAVVIEAIDAGALTFKHAELIARLTPDQHLTALEECYGKTLVVGSSHWYPRAQAIKEKKWDVLAGALVGTRELERFVTTRAKADVHAPEVQTKLREIVTNEGGEADEDPELADGQIETAVEEAVAELLQLSVKGGYEFTKRSAREARVVHKKDWKAAKPDSCKHLRRGIIVHPSDSPQVGKIIDNICASKACSKHHPKPRPMYNGASTETPAQRAARDAKEKAKTDRWKHFSAALTKAVYKAFDTQSSQLAKPVFARLCKALQLPASTTAAQLPKALLRSEIDTLFRHLGSWEEDAAVEWAKVLGVDVKACEPKAEAAGKPKSAKKAKKGRAA